MVMQWKPDMLRLLQVGIRQQMAEVSLSLNVAGRIMLNMILDEWMPWHVDLYDFSTIDINRYLCLRVVKYIPTDQ